MGEREEEGEREEGREGGGERAEVTGSLTHRYSYNMYLFPFKMIEQIQRILCHHRCPDGGGALNTSVFLFLFLEIDTKRKGERDRDAKGKGLGT